MRPRTVGDGLKVDPELRAPPALLRQSLVFLQVADPVAGPSAQPPSPLQQSVEVRAWLTQVTRALSTECSPVPRSGPVPRVGDSVSPPHHPETRVSPSPLSQGRKLRLRGLSACPSTPASEQWGRDSNPRLSGFQPFGPSSQPMDTWLRAKCQSAASTLSATDPRKRPEITRKLRGLETELEGKQAEARALGRSG